MESILSKFIIVVTICVFSSPLYAEIYKCNSNGVITFQDTPCDTADENLPFDSSKILGLSRPNFKEALNLDCTLERLENAVTMHIKRSENFYMICGRPANVNKADFLKILPSAEVLDKSPEQGMKFIQAITSSGYKYRVEWGVNEDTVRNATLFSLDKSKKVKREDSGDNAFVSGIKSYCKNKWSTNYRQQEYCIKEEEEAMFQLGQQSKKYQDIAPKNEIVLRCMHKWKGDGEYNYNYRQIVYCIKKEISAYDRIN